MAMQRCFAINVTHHKKFGLDEKSYFGRWCVPLQCFHLCITTAQIHTKQTSRPALYLDHHGTLSLQSAFFRRFHRSDTTTTTTTLLERTYRKRGLGQVPTQPWRHSVCLSMRYICHRGGWREIAPWKSLEHGCEWYIKFDRHEKRFECNHQFTFQFDPAVRSGFWCLLFQWRLPRPVAGIDRGTAGPLFGLREGLWRGVWHWRVGDTWSDPRYVVAHVLSWQCHQYWRYGDWFPYLRRQLDRPDDEQMDGRIAIHDHQWGRCLQSHLSRGTEASQQWFGWDCDQSTGPHST